MSEWLTHCILCSITFPYHWKWVLREGKKLCPTQVPKSMLNQKRHWITNALQYLWFSLGGEVKWSRVFHRSDCKMMEKKFSCALHCLKHPLLHRFQHFICTKKENKFSWFVSKIKYVDTFILLHVNAWNGREQLLYTRRNTVWLAGNKHIHLWLVLCMSSLLPFTDVATIFVFDSIKHRPKYK